MHIKGEKNHGFCLKGLSDHCLGKAVQEWTRGKGGKQRYSLDEGIEI